VANIYRRRKPFKPRPPLRHCEDGHTWYGWGNSCPVCATLPSEAESWRAFRKRVIEGRPDGE
jgi:hypothetical protein